MKIIFAGTPEFAACALKAIVEAGHEVSLVLTQPDRPAGRGMALRPSPVKALALELGLPVFQPLSLKKDEAAQAQIAAENAEIMVVAAYGLILPQSVLDMPRLGCINIHASLLPRWRGAAPIQRAIQAGDSESGVCIMQMEAGLDTGPVLSRRATPIGSSDTATTLHDRLARIGAELVVDTLARLPLPAEVQPEAGVTYAAKLDKAESQIDWTLPAEVLDRTIRAFNPVPGTQTRHGETAIKIWQATLLADQGHHSAGGSILSADKHGIVVACGTSGTGALCLTELQKAGGKRLPAAQFLAGNPLQAGQILGA